MAELHLAPRSLKGDTGVRPFDLAILIHPPEYSRVDSRHGHGALLSLRPNPWFCGQRQPGAIPMLRRPASDACDNCIRPLPNCVRLLTMTWRHRPRNHRRVRPRPSQPRHPAAVGRTGRQRRAGRTGLGGQHPFRRPAGAQQNAALLCLPVRGNRGFGFGSLRGRRRRERWVEGDADTSTGGR